MTRSRASKIRVFFAVFFLIVLPFKYALLWGGGKESEDKVISLSTQCDNGKPVQPKPRITVAYVALGTRHIANEGSEGVDFCSMQIGSIVNVTYFEIPFAHYMFASVADPRDVFWMVLAGGGFVNALVNLYLLFLARK